MYALLFALALEIYLKLRLDIPRLNVEEQESLEKDLTFEELKKTN